jgi:uncharacterized protein YdaU (DUF1376 family)
MSCPLPWFQFHGDDFFMDENVASMDDAAVSSYVRLLWLQWKEGSIPADLYALARILKKTSEQMVSIWEQLKPCYVKHVRDKNRVLNPRLDAERAKALTQVELNKQAGRKGGIAKAAKYPKIQGDS